MCLSGNNGFTNKLDKLFLFPTPELLIVEKTVLQLIINIYLIFCIDSPLSSKKWKTSSNL